MTARISGGRDWLLVWDDLLMDLWRRSDARIAAELSLAFSPEVFTANRVARRRARLGLPRAPYTRQRRTRHLRCLWSAHYRKYQHRHGWGHLLPDYPLPPRDVDILCLLRDRGPMTHPELAAALGCKCPLRLCHTRRAHRLRRLYEWGLVYCPRRIVDGCARRWPVYELAGPALAGAPTTSHDLTKK